MGGNGHKLKSGKFCVTISKQQRLFEEIAQRLVEIQKTQLDGLPKNVAGLTQDNNEEDARKISLQGWDLGTWGCFSLLKGSENGIFHSICEVKTGMREV